jgi:hypothetical protein
MSLQNRVRFSLWKIKQNYAKEKNYFEMEVEEHGRLEIPIKPVEMEEEKTETFHDINYADWKKRYNAYCKLLDNPSKKINIISVKEWGYTLILRLVDAGESGLAQSLDLEIENRLRVGKPKEELDEKLPWWWEIEVTDQQP